MVSENKLQPFGKSADFYGKLNKTELEKQMANGKELYQWQFEEKVCKGEIDKNTIYKIIED